MLKRTNFAVALAGAWTLIFCPPAAIATDLGGDCCADLEERIAELEATTARKGNRKVKLTISGWVNEAVFFWDDGVESDAYVGTNMVEQSRVRFVGEAKIDGDWSAGSMIELGSFGHASNRWDQDTLSSPLNGTVLTRRSNFFLKSKTWGRFLVGLEWNATGHLLGDTTTGLTATRYYADADATGIFMSRFLLNSGGARINGLRWNQILGGVNAGTPGQDGRHNIVRYDSPDISGFTGVVEWGEDDMWGASLAYHAEFDAFKLQAKAGYQKNTDEQVEVCDSIATDLDCQWFGVAATLLHVPSGLFIYGFYGLQDDRSEERLDALADGTDTTWSIQGGIEKAFTPLGKTTLFADYRQDDAGSNLAANFAGGFVRGSDVEFVGGGIIQGIDAAAMDLYMIYRHASGETTNSVGTAVGIDDFDIVIAGGRITF